MFHDQPTAASDPDGAVNEFESLHGGVGAQLALAIIK